MANKLKTFAMCASAAAGMVSANTVVVGFCMLEKDFASASASTLLNAMHENKFKAFASAAILPAIALAIGFYYVGAVYKGSLQSDDPEVKSALGKCKGNLSESLKIAPAIAINALGNLLSYTHLLTLGLYMQRYQDPQKGFFSNFWNATKADIAGTFQGAFSPKTTPLLGTLSAIQVASSLICVGLSLSEGQGR